MAPAACRREQLGNIQRGFAVRCRRLLRMNLPRHTGHEQKQ
jgi:hypothetical protein